MRSLNEFTILGNVGQKPEFNPTAGQNGCARFSVALNDEWADDRGDRHKRTTWVPCVAWNSTRRKLGTLVSDHVQKGDLVCVKGSLETFPLEFTRDGGDTVRVDRFSLRVQEIIFLPTGRKNEDKGND